MHVNVGDKIRVLFRHSGKSFDGIVIKVEPRLGFINGGSTKQSPLVCAKNLATGEIESFDNSFVQSITERHQCPAQPPFNIYRKYFLICQEILTDKKNIVSGPLAVLSGFYLARLNIFLPHPIDLGKLSAEYGKQKPGLIQTDGWTYRVKVKPFKKWLKKNAYKITQTSAQIRAELTLHEMEWETDAEEWLHADEEDEIKGSLLRDIEQDLATELLKRTPKNECGQC